MHKVLSQFLGQHLYLSFCLSWIPIFAVGYLLAKRHRRLVIFSGLFYMLVLPLYIPFEDEYWNPTRLGGWILGIEDLLLLFLLGSIPWAIMGIAFGKSLMVDFRWSIFLRRYGLLAAFGIGCFLVLRGLGIRAIVASAMIQLLISLLMITIRFDLWRLAVVGMLICPLLYFLVLKSFLWVFPNFMSVWNLHAFPFTDILGIPLGEIIWTYSGAGGYPIAMGYVFNARLKQGEAGVT